MLEFHSSICLPRYLRYLFGVTVKHESFHCYLFLLHQAGLKRGDRYSDPKPRASEVSSREKTAKDTYEVM